MHSLLFSPKEFSICKFSAEEWSSFDFKTHPSSFFSISKTESEISVIMETALLEKEFMHQESGWQMFYIQGSISFKAIAVLAPILEKLAKGKISVLVVSTFNTDYVFFKKELVDIVVNQLNENYSLEFLS